MTPEFFNRFRKDHTILSSRHGNPEFDLSPDASLDTRDSNRSLPKMPQI